MPAERLDVAVAVASRTLVRASDTPPGFSAVLAASKSNLDLILGSFHLYLIAVYPAPAAGFNAVAAAVHASLPAFLSRFFPFASRVVTNASTGVPQIACNNAGAELVIAYVGTSLAEMDFAHADRSLGIIHVPFEQGLALSLQLVRFACGFFFVFVWGTDQLLVDGHGLMDLPNAWSELLRTGGLSWEPRHERASLFRPRSPPRYSPALDAEFTRYEPASLPTPLLVSTLVRRMYVVSSADLDRLRAAASNSGRRATRLETLSAHVWKLLAAAVGSSDTHCRLAWLVDGRRHLDPSKYDKARLGRYLGNVVTYASGEAAAEYISSAPIADVGTWRPWRARPSRRRSGRSDTRSWWTGWRRTRGCSGKAASGRRRWAPARGVPRWWSRRSCRFGWKATSTSADRRRGGGPRGRVQAGHCRAAWVGVHEPASAVQYANGK
jgi:hypothetical protein